MSENADPNHRVVDVLAFLAANPLEEFSLAELSRELGLSKGTSHRLMTALAERQFVSRHPRRKTYSLGIALIAIGQAALEKHPGIAIARREMLRISTDLLVPCGITTVVGDQFLLLGREGAPQSQDGLVLVGERRMLVPPIGICHMAWRSDADIAAYLDRGAAYMSAPMRQHMLRAFPEIRRRGYAMAASGGSFTLAGADAAFIRGRIFVADAGQFDLTGGDAGFSTSFPMGIYALTGGEAQLVKVGLVANQARGRWARMFAS